MEFILWSSDSAHFLHFFKHRHKMKNSHANTKKLINKFIELFLSVISQSINFKIKVISIAKDILLFPSASSTKIAC